MRLFTTLLEYIIKTLLYRNSNKFVDAVESPASTLFDHSFQDNDFGKQGGDQPFHRSSPADNTSTTVNLNDNPVSGVSGHNGVVIRPHRQLLKYVIGGLVDSDKSFY